MMGVYIKGMEMPTSCNNCQIRNGVFCPIRNALADRDGKRCDCPLVPVPPHGRLIDADAFEEFIRKDWDKDDHWIAEVVYSRPTIISAEEEER